MARMPRSPLSAGLLLLAVACSSGIKEERESAKKDKPSFEQVLPEALRPVVDKPFKGDLEEMVKRRQIRIAVPYSRTHYFIDRGVQRGLSYDYGKLFEDELNEARGSGNLRINLVFMPLPRDAMLPALVEGRVDMVVAQLTVTPERLEVVDFTEPTRTGVKEVVVTGPGTPPLDSAEQLGGRRVFVRRTSSYFESVRKLNERLAAAGKAPVIVDLAPESLEDDDLLEMVNAGLVPAIIVDDYLARFWKQVFPYLRINEGAALRTDGRLAIAIRKNSPRLVAELNGFIARHGLESVMGRTLSKRYLQSTKYVTGAAIGRERQKLLSIVGLFRKYGEEYRVDHLLMAAQGYQESRLDQEARSPVGAIGVMQIMPATGAEQKVGDIRRLDPNIHAGIKYMRFMMDRYYRDEPMDRLNKGLFTFASYNAGPGRIARLRQEAAARGLNPNVWFGSVEQVASERIGRETVTYVANIYKYYIAYQLVMKERQAKDSVRAAVVAAGRR